jgi:hypothetical protein
MGKVIDALDERNNQPGKWIVTIGKGEASPVIVTCVNRPAISFGEEMLRVADVEFERWMPRSGVENIDVQMTAKRTLMQLVDDFGVDRLQEYARALRVSSSEEDDFHVAAILQCAAETYEAAGEFILGGQD